MHVAVVPPNTHTRFPLLLCAAPCKKSAEELSAHTKNLPKNDSQGTVPPAVNSTVAAVAAALLWLLLLVIVLLLALHTTAVCLSSLFTLVL
jgi:hypothetical protein